jgi:hypothetical protein
MPKLISEQEMKSYEAMLEAYIRKALELYSDIMLTERNRIIKEGIEKLLESAFNSQNGAAQGVSEEDRKQIGAEFQRHIDDYFHYRLPVDGAPDQLTLSRPTTWEIKRGLNDLIEGERAGLSGGFLVFGGESEFDFVQYTLHKHGFLLDWPIMQPGGLERLPKIQEILDEAGITQYSSISDSDLDDPINLFEELPMGFMASIDSGLIAQVGRDIHFVHDLTETLLREVFGFEPAP